jgi:hypothetical protein
MQGPSVTALAEVVLQRAHRKNRWVKTTYLTLAARGSVTSQDHRYQFKVSLTLGETAPFSTLPHPVSWAFPSDQWEKEEVAGFLQGKRFKAAGGSKPKATDENHEPSG